MSRRRWIVAGCVLALVVGLEVAVRIAQTGRSRVQIINAGATPIENLVVSYAGTRIRLGSLPPGATGYAYLSGQEKGTLDLAFTQAGNPLTGFQVADYDPRALGRDGLEQVLEVKSDMVTKYLDDAGSITPLSRLLDRIRDWIHGELDQARL
jgi:hypothetical protein